MNPLLEKIALRVELARVIVGGAPLTQDFSTKIGADAYWPGPAGSTQRM